MRRGIAAAVWLLSGACTFVGDGGTDQGPSLAEPEIEPPAASNGGGPAPEPEPSAEPEPEPSPDPTGAADDGGTPSDDPPDDPGKLPPPEDPPDPTGGDDGETGDPEPTVETCPDMARKICPPGDCLSRPTASSVAGHSTSPASRPRPVRAITSAPRP